MGLIHWYLCFQSLVSIFPVESNQSQQPQMKQQSEISKDLLRFTCIIENYDSKFMVHFHCDFNNKTMRCLENCRKISNIKFLHNCSTEHDQQKLIIHYDFNKKNMPTGNYNCEYKSIKSAYISYTQEKIKMSTSKSSNSKNPVLLNKSFVKRELTIALIGVCVLSLLVNVAFIIRCCIIRCYLNRYTDFSSRIRKIPRWSWVTCFCLKEELKATDMYYKTREDPYEHIRDHPSSETSKSKSSITNEYLKRPNSQDTEKLCFSSNTSQISRSSTFPARQSIIVHTPTDQFSVSAIPSNPMDCFQPFMIQYALDPSSKTMVPIVNSNRRLSSHCIYDDVPREHITMNPSSTIPIRHFASTGSLQNRSRHSINTNLKTSPLPEETQLSFSKYNKEPLKTEEEMGLMMNDCSSVLQDYSGSEETYLSGKDSDSMKDPVRVAKLEMSREMMAKADTLLREAHNLLKMS